jgi:hypothetical protein
MNPIILRPDDALTSKTVTVYTPPTSSRAYRSKRAACARWAKDLILQSPEPERFFVRRVSQCRNCGAEGPTLECEAREGSHPCDYAMADISDTTRYQLVKKRLTRWLMWRIKRAS